MNYFKKKREQRERKRLNVMLELFEIHAKSMHKSISDGVQDAIGIFNEKQYEYENNVRENLTKLIDRGEGESLAMEIAEVISGMSTEYGYRIAKGKREELGRDILAALSVKK